MANSKKNNSKRKALTAGVLIAAVLIAAFAFYLWFFMLKKPVMILKGSEVTVEAGKRFDEWSVVESLENVSKHPLPTTQEMTLHMDIIRWSILKSD